jgi:predicted aspartyl protease
MSTRRLIPGLMLAALAATLVLAVNTAVLLAQETQDPYEVLEHHFAAAGGLDRLKAERTQYMEGNISVAGMEGPIRVWSEKPDKSRVEVEIGPLKITQGENGEVKWVLDANSKLQVITKSDEATEKRDKVERLMAEYEYADRGSDVFKVALDGTEDVEGTSCYKVKVTNNINADTYFYFIGVDDLMLEKTAALKGEESADTYYEDYREVAGIMIAFHTREVQYSTGQPQEVSLTHYESNPAIEPGLFDPPEEAGKDYRFAAGDAAENMAFRFIGNHLFIPVTVEGKQDMWVIDTGAGMSVIDMAFAKELGLEVEGNLKGLGAGGTVDVGFAELPPFELEGISFDVQKVAVIDMAELVRRLGIEIAGILGFDFLSRFVTRIDYAAELISFYDPETFTYAGDGVTIDAHIDEGVFKTVATLDGDLSGTWLFDIGASSIHLEPAYALRQGYADMDGVLRMGHGAGNEYQVKGVRAQRFELGGFTLDRPLLSFRSGITDDTITSDKLGILGNSIFRNFVIHVDYARERVILEKGKRFNQPWPEDRSGLNVAWTPDHGAVEVLYISPGTPAERAGFEKGDVVISVDGEAIEPATGVLDVRDYLSGAPGITREILVDRRGKDKKIRIKLEDLYD